MNKIEELAEQYREATYLNPDSDKYACNPDCDEDFKAGALEVKAMAEPLVAVLRTHDCHLGSSYFDGEDRVVTECTYCKALAEWESIWGNK